MLRPLIFQTETKSHFSQVNGEELYIVVNAGCREKDLDHIGKHLKAFQVRGCVPILKHISDFDA